MVATIPSRRKFNGEGFVFDSSFNTRVEANREKKRLKKSGIRKVRVVAINTHLYVVYRRSL
jgi:hypothetical protein